MTRRHAVSATLLALAVGLAACDGDHDVTGPDDADVLVPPYNRAEWHHWIDADRDCQDTRAEVLIRDSTLPVTFSGPAGCSVVTGGWADPYGGGLLTVASDVDVDHLVPLENAHYAGGWAWDSARKEAYANSLDDPEHLLAVDDGLNQQKGSRGPEEWLPPDPRFRCDYVAAWKRIKERWRLTMTANERAAVEDVLAGC